MDKFATLTPDRGDRPQFMNFCRFQIERMGVEDQIMIVYSPVSNAVDIIPRIKRGIEIAKYDGIDKIVIVESDDFYAKDYISHINLEDYDFFGWGTTYYYNIRTRRYQRTYHEDTHSSLFCTAFRISALDGFRWPPDNYLWLDAELWKHARRTGKRFKLLDAKHEPPCIGIKHGVGKTGGKGHTMELREKDQDLSWLRSRVDNDAFEFYSNLKL